MVLYVQVLEELYAHSLSNAPDSDSAGQTCEYLKALNKLFERGFFSKKPLFGMDSSVICSIKDGY